MHFWIAIVVIVAIVSFAKTRRDRPVLAIGRNTEGGHTERSDSAALVREIAALNGRIAVLERIITENRSSQSLAHEIDALRDH